MLNDQTIKVFTAADIEKYHQGLLSAKERHALEKASLEDPFLADALEGYTSVPVNVQDDISALKEKLSGRIEKNKVKRITFPFWKAAAMIVLVAGAGLLIYQLSFKYQKQEMAVVRNPTPANAEPVPQADSVARLNPDSQSAGLVTQPVQNERANKKNVPSDTLVSPEGTLTYKAVESDPVKYDTAKNLSEPLTVTPGIKAEQNIAETKKSQRNYNANYKIKADQEIPEFKKKELTVQKQLDANGDGVPDRFDGAITAKPSVNNPLSVQQGYAANNQTNIFRGRVTDNNNNALPFSNITNLEDKVGTYSDARGYFNLTSPDSVLNVQVRSLGFENNNIQLQNTRTENKVLMEEDRSLSASILDTVKRNANKTRNNTMILEEPEPVDGWSNYDMYLVNNLKVPESFSAKQSARGEVQLSFEVDKNGEPINITVKKSLCESCDKEAIRLVKEGPKWKRKIRKGKATVTVAF